MVSNRDSDLVGDHVARPAQRPAAGQGPVDRQLHVAVDRIGFEVGRIVGRDRAGGEDVEPGGLQGDRDVRHPLRGTRDESGGQGMNLQCQVGGGGAGSVVHEEPGTGKEAGSPGRRKPSTYPSALSGNPQQIMEVCRVCPPVVTRVTAA